MNYEKEEFTEFLSDSYVTVKTRRFKPLNWNGLICEYDCVMFDTLHEAIMYACGFPAYDTVFDKMVTLDNKKEYPFSIDGDMLLGHMEDNNVYHLYSEHWEYIYNANDDVTTMIKRGYDND